jgi:transcriptional accessory protein Tex/SPT6
MRRFSDKRATVVDVTDKEVIDLFQDGLYHCRTFEDFGRRRPSSITRLRDMITSWADEEDKGKRQVRLHSRQGPAQYGWQRQPQQQQQPGSRGSQQQLLGS